MALIPAICPNCGALLNVNEGGKAEKCQYCGSSFIVDEAVHNFNNRYISVNNTINNIQAGNVIVEQGNPVYLEHLQRLKAAINKAKNQNRISLNDYSSIVLSLPEDIREKKIYILTSQNIYIILPCWNSITR